MATLDVGNPPNVGTITLHSNSSASYVPWLPLRPRSVRPTGTKPDIATVPVGGMYLGVGVYNNPPLPSDGEPDILTGAWLPVRVESKDPKPNKPKHSTLLVPYRTVFGQKRPHAYKQLFLVRGIKGAIVAPPVSECIEVLRSEGEALLLVNSGCTFQVTTLSDAVLDLRVVDNVLDNVMQSGSPTLIAATQHEATLGASKRALELDAEVDRGIAAYELWHRLSFGSNDELLALNPDELDWITLLGSTLKAMYPRWGKRIAHIYPEPPYKGVCLPLRAATSNSTSYGSQWAIETQYFTGFYDACGVDADIGSGAMPAGRLLMRCLYEMVWLSKTPKTEHPQEGSVLLTIPAMFD